MQPSYRLVYCPVPMEKTRIELVRADTSFKGEVHYADQLAGPDLQIRGDVAVEDVKANSFNAVAKKQHRAGGLRNAG